LCIINKAAIQGILYVAVSKAMMEDKALLSIYSELLIGAPLLETIYNKDCNEAALAEVLTVLNNYKSSAKS